MSSGGISVLFVCLGNICRSTMAQGVLQSIISKPPYEGHISHVDSCGTGAYHTGSSPDSRTMSTLKAHGIDDYVHSARKVKASDFKEFDFIFAMDADNLRDLQQLQRRVGGAAKVQLFGEFAGGSRVEEIQDPYYGGRDGFDVAYEQCVTFSMNFLRQTVPDAKR